jgi:hypothetical protein
MFDTIILQGLCAAGKSGPEYLTDFQFVKAISCTYADSAGLLVVGMLVYGGVSISIFARTGDIRIPAVLLLLTGGAVTSQIAAPGLTIAGLIVLLVGAGVLTLLYYRYSR